MLYTSRRNHFRTIFIFSSSSLYKSLNKHFNMFPRKGTFTLTPGWGWEGTIQDPPNPKLSPTISKNTKTTTYISNISKKKTLKTHLFPYVFPPEGNFDIDAGDGGGGGTIQDPRNPSKITKNSSCENCSHFCTFFKNCIKVSLEYLLIHRKRHRIR